MTYTLHFDEYMDCFVAIPSDENEDALTLCGETEAQARAFASRTQPFTTGAVLL